MKLYHNPEYDLMLPDWQIAWDLYEGCHDKLVQAKYLWLHTIEDTKGKSDKGIISANALRLSRQIRTRYLNLSEMFVSAWSSYFFKDAPIIPDEVTALFGGSTDNVDGYGRDLMRFVKEEIFIPFLLYGRCFIQTDAPQGNPMTKAQESYPTLRGLSPLCVTDWDIERMDRARIGKLNILRHEYCHMLPRMRATEEPTEQLISDELTLDGPYTIYRYKADVEMEKYHQGLCKHDDIDWQLEAEPVVTKLSEIPVSYIMDRSWMRDVGEEILRYYNLRSNKDNILYNQGFDKVFTKGVNYNNDSAVAALTEYTVVGLPQDGDAFKLEPVSVVGYDTALAEALDNCIKVGFNIFRSTPQDSKEGLSAEAVAAEKGGMYALVDSSIKDIENCINQAIGYAAQFKGIADFQERVTFPRHAAEESTEQFVMLVQAFQDKLRSYPKASKEILMRVGAKLDLSDEALEEIETTEIPEEPSPEEQRQQVIDQAINGNEAQQGSRANDTEREGRS